MPKCIVIKTNCGDNLKPIVNFTIETFSPVAADEVIERVDSAGDLEENEFSTVGSLLFEASEEDESGSVGDSEEDELVSVGDSEEDESGSVGDSEEDESGSVEDSEEDESDPRVQEEVGSRNDGIFSTERCDFLKLM